MSLNYECVDAGTEYCPCNLALTGDCLTCSRLQGKEFCDCGWNGVCVYNEFVQNGRRTAGPRTAFDASVVSRRKFDDLTVLELAVGRGFAVRASRPGSYVFLRRPDQRECYDVPISVLKTEERKGTIHVAIKELGPKSKALLEDGPSRLEVRGVYGGGLQGVRYLQPGYLRGKRVLFVTKGIGAAPALLTMQRLPEEVRADWIADEEKVGKEFLDVYGQGRPRESVSLAQPEQLAGVRERLKRGGYDVVAVMASDYFVQVICALAGEVLPAANLVWSNNARLCCGEGICGACTETTADGQVIRRCKCQEV